MIIKMSNFIEGDPKLLFEDLSHNISKGKKLILDFHSLESIPYDFLENTIGKLLEKNSFEDIRYQLNFKNVDVGIKEMLGKIVQDKYTPK